MEKVTKNLITNEFKVPLEQLTNDEKKIITWFEKRDLIKYQGVWKINLFLLRKFKRLLAQDMPGIFFQNTIQSLDKETRNIIVLSTEWFTDGGTNDPTLLTDDDEIEPEVLENLWQTYYKQKYSSFWLFDPANASYTDPKDAYQRIFFILYEYCGVPDMELAHFFDLDFQRYLSLIKAIANSVTDADYKTCYNFLVANFGFPITAATIQTQHDLDDLILAAPEHYDKLIQFCLDQFSSVRKCTEALLESLFTPGAKNPNAKLKGDAAAEIREFQRFNELLKYTLDTETAIIEAKHLEAVRLYLNAVKEKTIKGSGFKGMAERQLSFLEKFDQIAEFEAFQQMTGPQRIEKVRERNKDIEDISAFHRLKFALQGRDNLNVKERKIFYEKLASIVQNGSANVYSDIIELYLYFLFKVSGTPIEMLTAQTSGGRVVSTCDYKFGNEVAADCKCIITDAMKVHHISAWCGKIGSQIKSTIGHENVRFGGGVIALKDQEIDFLGPLRDFKGLAARDQEEDHRILEWILKIHAEFRRHTRLNAEQVKFIVLYYLPATAVSIKDLESADQFTVLDLLESLSIFTTKYASDDEFEEISRIFGPVTHYIFRFNNRLN